MKLQMLAALAVFGIVGCAGTGTKAVLPIGTARAAADFAAYDLRRVGVLPPRGENLEPDLGVALRDALAASFAAGTAYEIVPLGAVEMESIERLDPVRTGRIPPAAILEVARRAGLDAVLATRVVDLRPYEPVRLGIEVDLIAVETGLVTWSAQVRVDTGDSRTLDVIETWQLSTRAGGESERAVDILSPRRLAEFAAFQVAMLL